MQKYWPEDLQIVAKSRKNVYKNYKLLDWHCSQKYSTQILILQYVHSTDIYLTVCQVSCKSIDQKTLQNVAESRKNMYENYKLLDWLCSQKYSTQIQILQYVHSTDIYLTVCGVSCKSIDQKTFKLRPKVRKNVYENYKLLDWLCSQKYSTQIQILQYVHSIDIYLTVCGVSCKSIDQKTFKLWPKVGKTCTKITSY